MKRTLKNKRFIEVGGVSHRKSKRRLRKRMRRTKPAGEGAEQNDRCSKNRGHLGICLGLPTEAIAGRILSTIS